MNYFKEIHLSIAGAGIILYSNHSVFHINEGEDYFSNNYSEISDVLKQVYEGKIVGFSTDEPGDYILRICYGYPDDFETDKYPFQLRLGIEVKDNTINFRDLYDLLYWEREICNEQSVDLDNGFYHVTLCSQLPDSGKIGDYQIIYVYLNKLDEMPQLKYNGVPTLIR